MATKRETTRGKVNKWAWRARTPWSALSISPPQVGNISAAVEFRMVTRPQSLVVSLPGAAVRTYWHKKIGQLGQNGIFSLPARRPNMFTSTCAAARHTCATLSFRIDTLTFLWLTHFMSTNSRYALLAWVWFWKGLLSFLMATFLSRTAS